jgi:mono/diheme cytochrome c family protein
MRKRRTLAAAASLAFASFMSYESSTAASFNSHAAQDFIDRYCGQCHNTTDWAGSVAFDTMSLENLHADAAVWETTVRKLRGNLMPPPGNDRPEAADLKQVVAWLEGRLDEIASPRPGSPGLHRLNRREYANAVRDLFGISVDVQDLLPPDDVSHGFDNIAASLQVSPAFVDQYLGAARVVATQAIGSRNARPLSVIYGPPGDMKAYADVQGVERRGTAGAGTQRFHHHGMPFGTRGGMSVEHFFPADGEYSLTIGELAAGRLVPNMEFEHVVVALLDGKEFYRTTIGGPRDLKSIDQGQDPAADEINKRFRDIRFHATAGKHQVAVTFVRRSFAESDDRIRTLASEGGQDRVPAIRAFQLNGPLQVTGLSDSASRQRIFICRPADTDEEPGCASRIIESIAQRAFRRPLTAEDRNELLEFFHEGRRESDFEGGIRSAMTAILASPHFLYRVEPARGADADGVRHLTDLELATRLSFFLWSSLPDDTLLALATRGQLGDPEVLKTQVRRMLRDERARSLAGNFAFQWLHLSKLDEIIPDPVAYPHATGSLDPRPLFKEELRLFIDSVLRGNGSVMDLLTADHTFLNERLAVHYGITDVKGDRFRRVRLADTTRHGLFGKGAILMLTAYPNRTAPVLRGAWILDRLLGTPPAPPPPNVEALKETNDAGRVLSVREQTEAHSRKPACHGCHGVMDPLGFALENFDAVGQYRTRDRATHVRIDSEGVLPDGTRLSGVEDLRRVLAANPAQFVQALTERLLTYALGRELDHHDMPVVRAIVRASAADNYRFESIVLQIVSSDVFRKRQVSEPGKPASLQASAHIQGE